MVGEPAPTGIMYIVIVGWLGRVFEIVGFRQL